MSHLKAKGVYIKVCWSYFVKGGPIFFYFDIFNIPIVMNRRKYGHFEPDFTRFNMGLYGQPKIGPLLGKYDQQTLIYIPLGLK